MAAMKAEPTPEQREICERYQVEPWGAEPLLKVGVAPNVRRDIWPLNGLRHSPSVGTTGWFIWAGEEWSDDADFFQPLHVAHLGEWCPNVLPYLALPPGWRFLIAPGHEDAWEDPTLLAE